MQRLSLFSHFLSRPVLFGDCLLRVISLRHDAAVADNIPLEFCSRHDVDRLELKEGIEVEKPTYEACLISPSLMHC